MGKNSNKTLKVKSSNKTNKQTPKVIKWEFSYKKEKNPFSICNKQKNKNPKKSTIQIERLETHRNE